MRSKHGLQSRCSHSVVARGDSGGVWRGSLDPNSATCGRCNAAATCISPESLLTTDDDAAINAIASDRSVAPHRSCSRAASSGGSVTSARIASAATRSPLPPTRTTCADGRSTSSIVASAAKCEAGHRLAGPYSAPGHSAISSSVSSKPKRLRTSVTVAAAIDNRGCGNVDGTSMPVTRASAA